MIFFRHIVLTLAAMTVFVFTPIQDRPAFAANQAIVQDDLGGSQGQQTQEQMQQSEANPMQEPEQIEEAQNLVQAPQADDSAQPNDADEIEQEEAPPINQ